MVTISDKISSFYKRNGTLAIIITVNVALFLLLRFAQMVGNITPMLQWISVSADIHTTLHKPWCIFTYMWIHYDVWHLIFNMLWLFWMGKIFLMRFTHRQFTTTYIIGGSCGALLYIAVMNLFPSLFAYDTTYSSLIGASAAVMSIIAAATLSAPDFPVYIYIFGTVKLKWIAIVALILGCADYSAAASGSAFAHLGGAVFGAIFIMLQKRSQFGKPIPGTGHSAKGTQATAAENMAELNKILDKIKSSGYASLTEQEKRKLFDVSKKI